MTFLTRFSIFDKSAKGFCNKNITDEERLVFKLSVFEKVTLPSILFQSVEDWEWHIVAGEFTRGRISIPDDPRIKIWYVNKMEAFFNHCKKVKGTTIRIDDDDGLSHDYLEKLSQYKKGVVSFPRGVKFKLEDNKIIAGEKVRQKNIALGLARINGNIYACGNHTRVHEKYEVTYDESPDMYLLCCSDFCDTKRKF